MDNHPNGAHRSKVNGDVTPTTGSKQLVSLATVLAMFYFVTFVGIPYGFAAFVTSNSWARLEAWLGVFHGTVASYITLLAVWCALGSSPWYLRITISLIALRRMGYRITSYNRSDIVGVQQASPSPFDD